VKSTKTSGGGGNVSPSYNPPRDCNISGFFYLAVEFGAMKVVNNFLS